MKALKAIMRKDRLFIRVAIGFVLGVLLGILLPDLSIKTKVVGDIYLNMIKLMIIPIVFCAVFCGIANIRDGALLRRIGARTVILYVVMFVASSVVSLAIAWIIRPGLGTVFDNAPPTIRPIWSRLLFPASWRISFRPTSFRRLPTATPCR